MNKENLQNTQSSPRPNKANVADLNFIITKATGPSDDWAKRNIALESEMDHAHHDQVFYIAVTYASYDVVEVVVGTPAWDGRETKDPAQQPDEMLMNVKFDNFMGHNVTS